MNDLSFLKPPGRLILTISITVCCCMFCNTNPLSLPVYLAAVARQPAVPAILQILMFVKLDFRFVAVKLIYLLKKYRSACFAENARWYVLEI